MRIAIMFDESTLKQWEIDCINKLLELEQTEIVLALVGRGNSSSQKRNSGWFRLLERRLTKNSKSMKPGDIDSVLPELPKQVFHYNSKEGNCEAVFSEKDIEKLENLKLDVLLKFQTGPLGEKLLHVPRYGVWHYEYGEHQETDVSTFAFWDLYHNRLTSSVSLKKITASSRIVLKEGTFFGNIPYVPKVDRLHFSMTSWAAWACRDILNGNASYLDRDVLPNQEPDHETRGVPTNGQTFVFLCKSLKDKWKRIYHYTFLSEHWNAGIVDRPIEEFLTSSQPPEVKWIPRRHNFIADPFGLEYNNRRLVLVEECDYKTNHRVISVIELENMQQSSWTDAVIDLPVHISYPYIIEHNGDIYCIPETYQAREATLFKAKPFPDKWEKAGALITNCAVVDPTVIQHDGWWWLFATDEETDSNTYLHIWYSSELNGDWIPHPLNPVKIDIRSARPAGTPFYVNGEWYRPAQDSSKTYGGRIAVNRIKKLNVKEFEEEVVTYLEPVEDGPYPHGFHTISAFGNQTLVDAKVREFNLRVAVARLKRRLNKKRR